MKVNRAAARALDILDFVANHKDPLSLTEVSKALELPKTSAFELINALVEKGYIEIADQRSKTFTLGMKAFQTGMAYLENDDLRRVAHPLLEGMMKASGDTAFLVVESNGKIVYLDKVESTASIRTSATLGSTNPMHRTGLGKALLAAYTNEKVAEIINQHGMEVNTPYSISDLQTLLADLANARERGYAIDNRENEVEVMCVASPVYDIHSQPVAAISIASLASRMTADKGRLEQLGRLVNQTALQISKRLGFRQESLFPRR